MDKKIVNIGDIFVTKICNLKRFSLENVDTVKEICYGLLESDKYLYKSIYCEDIVNKNNSLFEKMEKYTIIIKYIGNGKFVELETGTPIICLLNYNLNEYELVDNKKESLCQIKKNYETYIELLQDIQYIRENPLILMNNQTDEIIRPILEYDKIQYIKYSQQERIEILEKIKNIALQQFEASLKRQVEVDHEIANLENKIKTFCKIR